MKKSTLYNLQKALKILDQRINILVEEQLKEEERNPCLKNSDNILYSSKNKSAVKRQTMEVTRLLADLRQNR